MGRLFDCVPCCITVFVVLHPELRLVRASVTRRGSVTVQRWLRCVGGGATQAAPPPRLKLRREGDRARRQATIRRVNRSVGLGAVVKGMAGRCTRRARLGVWGRLVRLPAPESVNNRILKPPTTPPLFFLVRSIDNTTMPKKATSTTFAPHSPPNWVVSPSLDFQHRPASHPSPLAH